MAGKVLSPGLHQDKDDVAEVVAGLEVLIVHEVRDGGGDILVDVDTLHHNLARLNEQTADGHEMLDGANDARHVMYHIGGDSAAASNRLEQGDHVIEHLIQLREDGFRIPIPLPVVVGVGDIGDQIARFLQAREDVVGQRTQGAEEDTGDELRKCRPAGHFLLRKGERPLCKQMTTAVVLARATMFPELALDVVRNELAGVVVVTNPALVILSVGSDVLMGGAVRVALVTVSVAVAPHAMNMASGVQWPDVIGGNAGIRVIQSITIAWLRELLRVDANGKNAHR